MNRRLAVLLLVGLVLGVIISGRIAIHAQERPLAPLPPSLAPTREKSSEMPPETTGPAIANEGRATLPARKKEHAGGVSVQEALLRPYRFPFGRPTSLEQVCVHLKETLKAAVVLDLAALDRKSLEPENTVQLELDGVRLKTGLKLLLDQVDLTYRVIAEDNLLIITDGQGSDDSAERVWSELRALHRDLHAVQDAVDDLSEYLGLQATDGALVRKPTIIEEMPDNVLEKPGIGPEKPGRTMDKPDRPGVPAPGSRSLPVRVPLAGPRRSI